MFKDTVGGISGINVDSGRGGKTGIAVDPNGKGDVTRTNVKWQADVTGSGGGSSGIIVGDHVYRANNAGLIGCWDLKTGEPGEAKRFLRITQGASPIATADGRIYFASSGRSYVIKAGPQLELLASNDLGEGNDYITPAVSGGRIFIKGKSYLWCIGKK